MKAKMTSFINIDALDKSLEQQTIAICEKVASQAKAFAPVDTGQLRANIQYKTSDGKSGMMEGGSRLQAEPKKGGVIGTNVLHGIYQEFGTRHMAPQPFLRPAAEVVRTGDIKTVLRKIEQETAKGPLTDKKRVRFT